MLISFEFGFLGGSLGERTGDRLEAAYAYAREHRLPVVPLVATGGSRMQEGMRALIQLQRVARQSTLTREAGLAQIAVLRDPTTGGGWATLGAGADVVLALPGAQVGFAGSRVRPPDADPAAYTAEAQWRRERSTRWCHRRSCPGCWAWLQLLTARRPNRPRPRPPGRHRPAGHRLGGGGQRPLRATPARRRLPGRILRPSRGDQRGPLRRHRRRHALRIRRTEGRRPDRRVRRPDRTATRPAGYRTAARLIRLAERLGIPVLTLVDTPGAANDAEAERQGAGAAIADVFGAVAARDTRHHAGDRRGRLGRGAGPRGTGQHLGHPGQLLLRHRARARGGDPQATAGGGTGDGGPTRIRPQDLAELGVVRGIVKPVRSPS